MDNPTMSNNASSPPSGKSNDADLEQPRSAPEFDRRTARQQSLTNKESGDALEVIHQEWFTIIHRVNQQDTMMKAIIRIFAWLNGAVILFILAAWGLGFLSERPPIITERVVMALISSTLIQAGLAFITITKFLFPASAEGSTSKRGHRKIERKKYLEAEIANRPKTAA